MDNIYKPAIVVIAYDRAKSLQRLLTSISKADFSLCTDIPLIISIDRSDYPEVREVAEKFPWHYGTKQIIVHKKNLGLKNHVFACCQYGKRFGSFILLEDDLVVSPAFYDFAYNSLNYYAGAKEISGIGLYSYNYNEYAQMFFSPLEDGYDNYFLQSAISWGQAWTRQHWEGFYSWYTQKKDSLAQYFRFLPQPVAAWPESSWKKLFILYLIINGKYFVIPRTSKTTNMAEIGVHYKTQDVNIQAPLLIKAKQNYNFASLEDSWSVYDAYYELKAESLKKLNPYFEHFDLECDLYGLKSLKSINSEYMLSIKKCVNPILSFGISLVPVEMNVFHNIEGSEISFGRTEDFSEKIPNDTKMKEYLLFHKIFNKKFYTEMYYSLFWEAVKSKFKTRK